MAVLIINKLRSWLPISIVVFCVIAFFADAQQKEGESAACSLSTAFYQYDIGSLYEQNFSIAYDAGMVYFTICAEYTLLPVCPASAAVCLRDGNDFVSGGELNTQKMSVTGNGEGIQIVYDSGSMCSYTSSWATVINIQCDSGPTQVLSAYDSDCTMNINILSPAACPVQKRWVVPVLVVCIIVLVLLAMYPLFLLFRRLNRSRTHSITPASPEEIIPLLSPSPSSPSLFINDYICTKQVDGSPPAHNMFLLDPPSPAEAKADANHEKTDPENTMCKICWARSVNCALVDCGHLLCVYCAANVNTCPFCRRKVITRIKLYYS